MGRIFEALLKQAGRPDGPVEPRPSSPLPAGRPEAPRVEGFVESSDDDVPFIEVGPRRGTVEASASVLATAPVARKAVASPPPPSQPVPSVVFRPLAAPAPHSVTFRPVPERKVRFPAELVAYHSPGQPASATYRDLLSALLAAVETKGTTPALLFSAIAASVGTTTVLLNVAITAAQQGRRTIVVDANLSAPAVADRLGLARVPGVREVLAGSVTLEQALQQTEQAGLLALTLGEAVEVAPQPTSLRALLRLLRSRFDLVLVDGAGCDGQADFAACAACDAVYLVVPEAEADSAEVQALLRGMSEKGARPAGRIVAGR